MATPAATAVTSDEARAIAKEAYIYDVHRYTVRFEADRLPPAHAFWSITMYELPASLLVANPIDGHIG